MKKSSLFKAINLIIRGGVLSFSLFLLTTCGEDTGLGPSVDTKEPTIEITYPPSDAIIRDWFWLGGTCDDDKSVKEVSVVIKKISEDIESESAESEGNKFLATVSNGKSWQIKLNEKDGNGNYEYPDGSYEVTVTAYDHAGHDSGKVTRQFMIDNTAPVLVVTKPASKGAETPRSYGRTVQIEGGFSELCSSGIAKLLVSFYNEEGTGLLDAEFNNITDMSNANPLTIAQYYDKDERETLTGDELELWQNYLALYTQEGVTAYENEEEAKTVKIYFTVTAYDDSKVYQDFDTKSSGAGGNSTSTFYRSVQEMTDLVYNKNPSFPNFSTLSLRNYLSGTDTTYSGNTDLSSILTTASTDSTNIVETPSVSIDTLKNVNYSTSNNVYLNFSINPNNNPTFTVNGMALATSDTSDDKYNGGYIYYFGGTPINVSFNLGLDKDNLDTSTISLYYTKESTDENGNTVFKDADKKLFWTYNADDALEYARKNDSTVTITQVETTAEAYHYTKTSSDANTDSLSLQVKDGLSSSDVESGYKYKFSVKGKDLNGREIVPSVVRGFGLYAKSSVSVPSIAVDDYVDTEPYKNMSTLTAFTKTVFDGEISKISFSGIVKSEEELKDASSMTYTLTLSDAADSLISEEVTGNIEYTQQGDYDPENKLYTYKWSFDFSANDQSAEGKTKLQNLIENGSGLYTVGVTISARNGGGSAKRAFTYYLDTTPSKIINLNLVANEPGYTAYRETSTDENAEPVFYVNNAGGTFTLSCTTTDNYKVGTTTYKVTGNGSEVTGESGVGDISCTFEKISLTGFSTNTDNASEDAIITIFTTDIAGNESHATLKLKFDTTPPAWKESEYFKVNGQACSLIEDSDDFVGKKWFKDSTLPVSGCYTDEASGVSTVYYWIKTPGATSEPNISDLENATSFSDLKKDGSAYNFTKSLGSFETAEVNSEIKTENTLYFVAVDNIGNKSSLITIAINLDNTSPSLIATTSGNEYTNKVEDISISGTYADEASGVSSIVLKINDIASDGATLTENSEKPLEGTWTLSLSASSDIISKLENGKSYPVLATITDNAGNPSTSTIFNLQIDTEAPPVSVETPTPDSTADKINGTVTVSGTVKSNSGAEPKELVVYATSKKPTSETTLDSSDLKELHKVTTETENYLQNIYSWSCKVDAKKISKVNGTSDSYENQVPIYIIPVVYDTAGNCNVYTGSASSPTYKYVSKSEATTAKPQNYFEYNVDQNTDRPIITITSISSSGTADWLKDKIVKGSISDDDSTTSAVVKKFCISEKASGDEESDWTEVSISGDSWTYTLNSSEGSDIPLRFKVIDNAGTIFVTGNSDKFTRPYYRYYDTTEKDEVYEKNGYGIDSDKPLGVNLDISSPKIHTLGVAGVYDKTNPATYTLHTADDVKAKPENFAITDSKYAGGSAYKEIKFYVPAFDENIDTVTLIIKSATSGKTEGEYELDPTEVTTIVSGTTYTYYETKAIDISEFDSGKKTVKVTVKDKALNEKSDEASFRIDNTPPEKPNVTSPSSDTPLTGTQRVVGSASDTDSEISNIEYLVPPSTYTETADDSVVNAYEGWTDQNNTGTARAFRFSFTAGSNYDLNQYDDADGLKNYAVEAIKVDNKENGTYKIPIFFRLTDMLGNVRIYRDFYITHDPDGDRPVTGISYPSKTDYDDIKDANGLVTGKQDYTTLAGVIRVNGSATIPSNTCDIGTVYIQLGTVDSTGNITWSKTNASLSKEFTELGGVVEKPALINEFNTVYNVDDDWWGIAANLKSKNWNISLNKNSDLDNKDIVLRACAINENGKMGTWSDIIRIKVDADAPTQSAEIRHYKPKSATDSTQNFDSSSPDANVLTSKEFEADMYLKGTWYLVVTLKDNENLVSETLSVQKNYAAISDYTKTVTKYSYTDGSTSESATDEPSAGKTVASAVKKVYIPVETESLSAKSITYSVSITDNSGFSSTGTYLFNIDNTAPEITAVTGNGATLATNSAIKNSDGSYDVGGTVKESGSGLNKFFFYFLRDSESGVSDGSENRLLDPMIQSSSFSIAGTEGTDYNKYSISQDSTKSYTLYGKSYTGSLTSRTSFKSDSISDDEHIRAGGLIYIGGDYQIIASKSGNTVTFDTEIQSSVIPDSELSNVTAGFPYGQVIYQNDDGSDTGMSTTFKSDVGGVYILDGIIDTTFMKDGPVKFVCIAFDNAGNVSGTTVIASIRNNAPRLAKLHLGTDLSGDEKYTYSTTPGALNEFNTYTFATATTNASDNVDYIKDSDYVESVELKTAETAYASYGKSFKIRSGLAVIPEITGGNDNIIMVWKNDATGTTAIKNTEGTPYSVDSTKIEGTFAVATNKTSKNEDKTYNFVIPDSALNDITNTEHKMSFTFWDKADGTKQGVDSFNCVVYVTDLTVDRTDSIKPNSVFNPFYWNSKSDNSLYGNSSLNGHIELEADWMAKGSGNKYITSYVENGTNEKDADPKVSGKITMTGYAYDNQRLSSIWMSFDSFADAVGSKFLSSGGDASKTMSGVTASGGKYTFDSKTYYQVAYYTPSTGAWEAAAASMSSDNWEFSVNSASSSGAYLSQSGHKVLWTFSVNTEKISNMAAYDQNARVIAFDHAGNVVDVTTNAIKTPYDVSTQTTNSDENDNAPFYKMDIVPYITEVTTALSDNNTKSGEYDRTALGHYPVFAYFAGGESAEATASATVTYEKIKIAGFNLKKNATVILNGVKYESGLVFDLNDSAYTFTIDDKSKSGNLSVTVNNVESLNNVNNNGSSGSYDAAAAGYTLGANGNYGAYSNYYNRQPNGLNNNILTDDVVLDIWDFNTHAAKAYDNGMVDNLEMKINPVNGVIGFAFSNGPTRFAMPNGNPQTVSSYTQWNRSYDYMSYNALAYDSKGYSYSVSVGGDVNEGATSDVMSLMSSRWSQVGDSQGSNRGGLNHLRLDSIGQRQESSGTYDKKKERFQSQSFATHATSDTSTDVYLAYYDLLNEEIRFKAGTITTKSSFTANSRQTRYGNFLDIDDAQTRETNSKTCQIIANGDTEKTLGNVESYVSIGVTSDNKVVLVWYDGKDLKYSYNKNPLAYADRNDTVLYAKSTGWETAKTLIPDGGEYCQLVVDSDNGVHIAAYADSSLKYVYLKDYDKPSEKIVSTVDSYGDYGENLTIDVAKDGAWQIPYIGYWGAFPSKPRYAYIENPKTFYEKTAVDGAANATYTGVWECSVVPTHSDVLDRRKMNVGVWKKDGALAYSTENLEQTGSNNYKKSYAMKAEGSNIGMCYGNGTSNGVMAYVIAISASQYNAETAQKR